ncbi:MAG: hypothetical protein LBN27_11810 [Prevotellaceae bacterium]|jgi:hypothetical protein|nr:hypothetical protein [Prevotellaceae bacterium]
MAKDKNKTRIYEVQGGLIPNFYRATTVSVDCATIEEGCTMVKRWAKVNFPDWNRIGYRSDLRHALIKKPIISSKVGVYVKRN